MLPEGRKAEVLPSVAALLAQSVMPQFVFIEANLGSSGGALTIKAEVLESIFEKFSDVVICLVSQGSGAGTIYPAGGVTFEALKAELTPAKQAQLYDGVSVDGVTNVRGLLAVLKNQLRSSLELSSDSSSGLKQAGLVDDASASFAPVASSPLAVVEQDSGVAVAAAGYGGAGAVVSSPSPGHPPLSGQPIIPPVPAEKSGCCCPWWGVAVRPAAVRPETAELST